MQWCRREGCWLQGAATVSSWEERLTATNWLLDIGKGDLTCISLGQFCHKNQSLQAAYLIFQIWRYHTVCTICAQCDICTCAWSHILLSVIEIWMKFYFQVVGQHGGYGWRCHNIRRRSRFLSSILGLTFFLSPHPDQFSWSTSEAIIMMISDAGNGSNFLPNVEQLQSKE